MNKKLFIAALGLFCSLAFAAKPEGSVATIILSESERALLVFDIEVQAVVGKVYKTDIADLTFKVHEISPRATRVYGFFNKKKFVRPDKIFIEGLLAKREVPVQKRVAKREVPVEKRVAKKKSTKKKIKKEKPFKIEGLTYSMFYTFSFGNFYERIDNVSAESSQNSPFTIGGSLNFKLNEKFSCSGSTYFSQLNSAISTSTEISSLDKKADIPWEYGFTSYLEYSGFKHQIKPYVGFDYESFSTFNTDELRADSTVGVDVRTHSFLYGTVGVYTFTKIFQRPSIIKASVSTNFTSSSSRKSTVSNEDFNGQKFIFFLGSNIRGNWGASFIYKQHMMTGPTDLTISRIGFGISYKFQ
jgi:hypothetical protein